MKTGKIIWIIQRNGKSITNKYFFIKFNEKKGKFRTTVMFLLKKAGNGPRRRPAQGSKKQFFRNMLQIFENEFFFDKFFFFRKCNFKLTKLFMQKTFMEMKGALFNRIYFPKKSRTIPKKYRSSPQDQKWSKRLFLRLGKGLSLQ